ncbi:MAG: hypothetical protein J7K01_05250 [Thermovirga sp.]|nr:hypothetical protein [Thermovirga sp.]
MKMSNLFAPTIKEAPKGIVDQGILRLVRGAFVNRASSQSSLGLLPLGVALFERVSGKVEELFDASAFQQVDFYDFFGQALEVASGFVKSYRQLPLTFYQKKNRVCEVLGFTELQEQAEELIGDFCEKFSESFLKLGLSVKKKVSLNDGFESLDLVTFVEKSFPYAESAYYCKNCSWCGWEDSPVKQEVVSQDEEPKGLEVVDTPGADTIVELCNQLGVSPENTIKTMFYVAEGEDKKEVFVVLVRGDHKISEEKVKRAIGCSAIRFADPLEIKETVGDLAGYLGPVGLPKKLKVIADFHVRGIINAVVGANQPEKHMLNVCWGRDFTATQVKDLIIYERKMKCPMCSSDLDVRPLAKVASFSSDAGYLTNGKGISYQGKQGKVEEAHLWKGEIYLEPLALSLVKPNGPLSFGVAPFDVSIIVPSVRNKEALALGGKLEEALDNEGFNVLLDDRDERAGVKFSDAELLGSPVTVICGKMSAEGIVELSYPDGSKRECKVEDVVKEVRNVICTKCGEDK